jgi:hypothetical protein
MGDPHHQEPARTALVLDDEVHGCALAQEVTVLSPRSKILRTSGFPGARLTGIQGIGTSIRLLSKPYRNEELSRTIREVLAGRA